MYDGSGNCAHFIDRLSDYELFQVDYLFGFRDRIANCFTLDGHLLILDTGYANTTLRTVNFGRVDDYLEHHVAERSKRLHAVRTRYPYWFADLQSFVRRSRWVPDGTAFDEIEQTVLARARRLVALIA